MSISFSAVLVGVVASAGIRKDEADCKRVAGVMLSLLRHTNSRPNVSRTGPSGKQRVPTFSGFRHARAMHPEQVFRVVPYC